MPHQFQATTLSSKGQYLCIETLDPLIL